MLSRVQSFKRRRKEMRKRLPHRRCRWRGVGSRPSGGKAAGRWRVSCDAQAAKGTPVDGRRLGPAKACLLTGVRRHRSSAAEAGLEASEGWASSAVRGRKRRRSAALLRCGAPLFALRREGSVASSPEAGGSASTEPPPASRASQTFETRESSGRSGARAVSRLQRSVRGIFPSLPPSPVRVTRAASDSTVRPLP